MPADKELAQAADVYGPNNGATTYSATATADKRMSANVTISTTAARLDLRGLFQKRYLGNFLRIHVTVAMDFFFTDVDSEACVYQAVDATTPEAQGLHLADGGEIQLKTSKRYLSWDGSAAGIMNIAILDAKGAMQPSPPVTGGT